MIHFQQKIWIEKARKGARPKWKVTRTKNRLENLANAMARGVRIDLVKGFKKFKSKINPEEIYSAWISKDWNRLFKAVPFQDLPHDLAPFAGHLEKSLKRSSDMSINALPAPVQDNLRFDLRNPQIRDYVNNRTGTLITNIESDTRSLIQNAVARHFDDAMTPRRVADMIKPSIGLYPQQVTALENYKSFLLQQGEKPGRINELAEKYEDRLLDYRSMMIARTETKMALNEGQMTVWNQAADQGLIDRQTVKKQWVLDGNPCEVCQAVLDEDDGGAIPLNDMFSLDFGGKTGEVQVLGPPSHPNCMCSLELIYPETASRETEVSEESED